MHKARVQFSPVFSSLHAGAGFLVPVGDQHAHLREALGQVLSYPVADHVLGGVVAGVQQVDTQCPGLQELVILHIGSDKGVTDGDLWTSLSQKKNRP